MSVNSSIAFSYAEFGNLVRRFAEQTPQLLLRHPATAELAFQIEQLRLTEALESRFTVAIIGQMRVGKSTLLNALIGRPLAPTGITETTATINWFRYDASGALHPKFRVHWLDGSSEDLPLERVSEWLGEQENASKTRSLDFFADSDFLKIANIVDTPGTRSVVEGHTEATQGLLAEKWEAETLKYGGRADAVVYVINPVGKASDRDLLQLFGERTRLPGASAYNSIAVVQKWEHLEPDPVREVARKCERLRDQLQGKVAEVLPCSGLLANTVLHAPARIWDEMAMLATASTPEAVTDLLLSMDYFVEEAAGVALDVAARNALANTLQWPALRFCLWLAQVRQLSDGAALRQAVWDVSGIERLKSVLQNRFFSLAGLIQADTAFRKALDPCNIALLRFRELLDRCTQDRALGQGALTLLGERLARDSTLEPVLKYVQGSLASVEHELHQVEQVRRELDAVKSQAEHNFWLLDADLDGLEALETLAAGGFLSQEERSELERLFGQAGPAIATRLGLAALETVDAAVLDRVWERHSHWTVRKVRATGELRRVCEQAVDRLEGILNYLEEQTHD